MKKELIDIPRLSKGIQKHLKQSGYTNLKLSEVQQAVSKSLGFKNLHEYETTVKTTTATPKKIESAIHILKDKITTTLHSSLDFVVDFVGSELGKNLATPEDRRGIAKGNNFRSKRSVGSHFNKELLSFYFNNSNETQFFHSNMFLFDHQNVNFAFYHLVFSITNLESMPEYQDLYSLPALNKTILQLKSECEEDGNIFIENFLIKLIYILNFIEKEEININKLFDLLVDLDIYLFNFYKSSVDSHDEVKFTPARLFYTSQYFLYYSFSFPFFEQLYSKTNSPDIEKNKATDIKEQFNYFLNNKEKFINNIE